MHKLIMIAAAALGLLVAAAAGCASVARPGVPQEADACAHASCFSLVSTIAFSSSRDNPTGNPFLTAEIYLMNPDGTNPRRLTDNTAGDAFAALSPNGKKIAFDSNRNRLETEPLNTADLFVMDTDGGEQTLLTRGSSAAWSPDSKNIAFHASASGLGAPIRTDPGSATTDSDIFVANVDDLITGVEQPRNITNSADKIDDDADWSPTGQTVVYTAHYVGDEGPNYPRPPFISNSAEIYVLNADGSGTPTRLTDNDYEERGPDWSPDGTRIEFMCRIGGGSADFEVCVMDADGSNLVQLTENTMPDLSANWSPDGQQLVFHRPVGGPGLFQLFEINSTLNADGAHPTATQITSPPGVNAFAEWGLLRVKGSNAGPVGGNS
jgi:TolB protein